MAETRREPLPGRWIIAVLAMILLAVIAIGSAGYTATIANRSNKQAVEIINLKAEAAHARAIRQSELRSSELRSQSECRSAIRGSAQVRTIIEDLRSTYLELAATALNPEFVAALKKRARHLPKFPAPRCDPGGKKL